MSEKLAEIRGDSTFSFSTGIISLNPYPFDWNHFRVRWEVKLLHDALSMARETNGVHRELTMRDSTR